MAISVGDSIPSVTLKQVTEAGAADVDTAELFAGKKAILFGLPGAFTPTCSQKHLPGFVAGRKELADKGVDLVACLSVNDMFVMEAWAKEHDALGKVVMLADGSALFTKALGLELDLTGAGLGVRCKRFAAVVEGGKLRSIDIDEKGFEATACEVVASKV